MKFKTLRRRVFARARRQPGRAGLRPGRGRSGSDEQPKTQDGRNNDIIVTAEFREANLQDTPIAITAVNAEMLEARGQTNIAAGRRPGAERLAAPRSRRTAAPA